MGSLIFYSLGTIFAFTLLVSYIYQTLFPGEPSRPPEVSIEEINKIESEIKIEYANGEVETLKFYHAGDVMFNNKLLVRLNLTVDGYLEVWDMTLGSTSLFKLTRPGKWQDKVSYSLEAVEKLAYGTITSDSIQYINDMVKHIGIYNQYVKEKKLKPIWAEDHIRFE